MRVGDEKVVCSWEPGTKETLGSLGLRACTLRAEGCAARALITCRIQWSTPVAAALIASWQHDMSSNPAERRARVT